MSGLVSLRIVPVAASIRIAERSAGSGAASLLAPSLWSLRDLSPAGPISVNFFAGSCLAAWCLTAALKGAGR